MPTIAEDSTSQQVFDYVVKHLRTQGRQSLNPSTGDCLYRNPNGLSCAVGCLVKTSEYSRDLEGNSIEAIVRVGILSGPFWWPHVSLLTALQELHDTEEDFKDPKFERAVRQTAWQFKLKYPKPTQEQANAN